VDEAVDQGAGREPTFLASGFAFPDALAAVPAARALGGTLLLVDPAGLDPNSPMADELREHAAEIDTVVVAGGTSAVNTDVDDQVQDVITAPGES